MAESRRPPSAEPQSGESAPSFEAALERLETIVDQLERGALSLEESIACYEEGIRLSKQLTRTLDQAEKRIERLSETPDGAPVTEPMELDERESGAPRDGRLPL